MAALEKMTGHPKLYQRGAVYYHRAATPKDIAANYPNTAENFSLGTSNYQEALRSVRVAAIEVDQRFAERRRKAQRPLQGEQTPEQLTLIHDTYLQHLLEEDEKTRHD